MTTALPLLFSFRRCPYAIRARLALAAAEVAYEKVEVVLRDKPAALLRVSPKGTVPVLVLAGGTVIDESLDIMLWALRRNDSQRWLQPDEKPHTLAAMLELIADMDAHFKPLLDRCKYPERFAQHALADSRAQALQWLQGLERRLCAQRESAQRETVQRESTNIAQTAPAYLFGPRVSLADAAVFPFVRQFAAIDPAFWDTLPLPTLQAWRHWGLQWPLFERVMAKSP